MLNEELVEVHQWGEFQSIEASDQPPISENRMSVVGKMLAKVLEVLPVRPLEFRSASNL